MRKYYLVLVIPLLLMGQSMTRLEYVDPYDRPMTSYKEWLADFDFEPFSIGQSYYTGHLNSRQELIDIVVYAPIYNDILDSLIIHLLKN